MKVNIDDVIGMAWSDKISFEEIKKRIGQGQQRGLAAPEGLSIDDIYKEREPLYKKWADTTLNGKDSVENLLSTILSFI